MIHFVFADRILQGDLESAEDRRFRDKSTVSRNPGMRESPDKTDSGRDRWHIQAYSALCCARICDPLRNFPDLEPSIVQKFPGRGWTSSRPRTFRNSLRRAPYSDIPPASGRYQALLPAIPKRRRRREFLRTAENRSRREYSR